jgi:hypothetical protein
VRVKFLMAAFIVGVFAVSLLWADEANNLPPLTSQPASQPAGLANTPAGTDATGAESAASEKTVLDYAKDASRKEAQTQDAPATEGPPLPFHTIEGYGGGALTPMAYLVNPGKKGDIFGLPSASFSNVIAGEKNLQSVAISETLFGRIELSYAAERFGIGTLDDDIKKATGVDIDRDAVYLHNFNVRGLLVEENSFGTKWLPALTGGVHFKVNDGIADVNRKLGGALTSIGYDEPWGVDFTLTASKTLVEKWTFNRPLILTVGGRNSDAAQLGFLGFGSQRTTTVEASAVYLPTDWLLVGYEFRQKANPYDRIPGLVGDEDNWQAVDVSWLINKNMTLTGGWGILGNVANTQEDGAWFLQFKYEF